MTPRKTVVSVAVVFLVLSIISLALHLSQFGASGCLSEISRVVLGFLMAHHLVNGQNSIRWGAVILMCVIGVLDLMKGSAMFPANGGHGGGWLFLVMGLMNFGCVLALVIPPGASHFKR